MTTAGKVLSVILLVLAAVYFWLGAHVLQLRKNWAERVQQREQEIAAEKERIQHLLEGKPDAVQAMRQAQEELREALDNFFNSDAPQRLVQQRRRWSELVAEPDLAQPQEVQEVYNNIRQIQAEMDQLAQSIEEKFNQLLSEVARASRTEGGLGIAQIRAIIPLIRDAADVIEAWRRDRQAIFEALTAFYENQRLAMTRRRETLEREIADIEKELDRLREQLLSLDQAQIPEVTLRAELRDHPALQLTADDLKKRPFAELRETLRASPPPGKLVFAEHVRALVELTEADLKEIRGLLEQRQQQLQEAIQKRDQLLQENKSLVQRLAAMEAQVDAREGDGTLVVTADGKIPEGEIIEVRPESYQVVVNLGRKDGLRPRVKLHVYRTEPTPTYLGMIQIQEVYEDKAVGVILPAYRDLTHKKGDRVAARITRR